MAANNTNPFQSIQESAKIAREYMSAIDSLLERLAVLLDQIQPPFQGKIILKLYRERGGEKTVSPAFYRWVRVRGGWRAKEVALSRISRRVVKSKEFHDTHQEVARLLQLGQGLLQRRRDMVAVARRLEQSLCERSSANKGFMEQVERHIYTFEDKFKDEVFRWNKSRSENMDDF